MKVVFKLGLKRGSFWNMWPKLVDVMPGGGGTSIYLGYGDVPPFRVTFCSKLCSLRVCFSSYPKLCSLKVYIFLHHSTQGRYFLFFISSKVFNFSPTLNLISTIVSTTYPYLSSSILCTPLNVAQETLAQTLYVKA